MQAPVDSPASRHPTPGLRVAAGLFGAALLLAAVDAAGIALTVPLPSAGLSLRVQHHLFDAAETLGVGAFAGAVAGMFVGFARPPRWLQAILAIAATMVIAHVAVGEGLNRLSSLALEGRHETAICVAYYLGVGVAIPAAYATGALFARWPRLRPLAILVSIGALAVDYVPVPDDHHGIHAVAAWGASLLGGAALAPLVERAGRALVASVPGRCVLAAAGVLALGGLAVPPPNAVRCELFAPVCSVAPWVLATMLWRAPSVRGPAPPPPTTPWFQDPASLLPVPPTAPRLLPDDAVVVLVTIDSARFDAIADPANDALLPTFAAMKRQGVFFTRATAPASQTALSLGTIFSGRYFSEQHWTDHGQGRNRFLYLPDDTSVRFPEVLRSNGVITANFASLIFLANEYGVVRGFDEETVPPTNARHAWAVEVIDPLIARLRAAKDGPMFLYAHLMEPHEPYDRGRRDGTPRERHLSEIALVDAQIARVEDMLDRRFRERWALFVSADHGEAFGEHGGVHHAKTLYQELLHVPLVARSRHFRARRVDEPVGLVDLGPTILDLFGLATPPTFMGQSLAPILAGGEAPLARPLLAEGRLRRALTTREGLKVIEDLRRKTVEVYDLARDPGERENLFDVEPLRSDLALAELRAFFAVHTRTEDGYEVPYKP